MTRTFRRGRPTRREQIESFNAATTFYARAADKDPAPYLIPALPPKRHRIKRPVDGKPVVPLEREVLANALQALRNDPRVWTVDRRQSGVFQDGDRYIRVGTKGVLDISGMLRGGKYFEIEAKRPGERPTPEQEKRIEQIRRGGGISGYFTSAEAALALLP